MCGKSLARMLGLLMLGLGTLAAAGQIPELPELNWEKRSDWINVKTGMAGIGPAAVGDGVADDTDALQAAFDEVSRNGSTYSTVYFPPGTYRITRTINPRRVDKGATSMHIRGHGRSTRIVWDGPEGGTMLLIHSFGLSTYIGTVWDGRGKAARGFVHDGGNETKVKHEHQAFMNCTEQGSGATEERLSNINKQGTWYIESSEWRNCLFINNGKGLAFWHYNDYIFTIDGSNIPWKLLGGKPAVGAEFRVDFGVLFGGEVAGRKVERRAYWENSDTQIVADIPTEAALKPANWGVGVMK